MLHHSVHAEVLIRAAQCICIFPLANAPEQCQGKSSFQRI